MSMTSNPVMLPDGYVYATPTARSRHGQGDRLRGHRGHPQGLPLVGDFETSYALLGKLGYASKAYQENRGHNFSLDGVQLEIEAGNRAEVVRVAALLGLWGSKPDGSEHDQDLRSLQHRPVRHRRSALRRGVSACCGAPDFYAKGCTAAWTC